MSLANPLPGGYISQRFGPSPMSIQPSMWHTGTDRAWWTPYPGGYWNENVHAGTDFAGKSAGTPLVAAQTGIVVRNEYDRYNGGGWVVEVEIKPGVRYSYNHCQSIWVGLGQKVTRGQQIAGIGTTGTIWNGSGFVRSSYGVHNHAVLTINTQESDGQWRPMLYDFADFMDGGPKAGSPLIAVASAPTYRIVKVRVGVNIRSTPDLDVGATNIAYACTSTGIYDRAGNRVANNTTGFQLRGTVSNDDGTWGKLWGFNRYLYVYSGLYY